MQGRYPSPRGDRKRSARAIAAETEAERQLAEAEKLIKRGLPKQFVYSQFGSLARLAHQAAE